MGPALTPEEELEKLCDYVVVRTVVDEEGMNADYTIKSADDMYYDPNRENKMTADNNPLNANKDPDVEIPLSHYIDRSVFEGLFAQLKDGSTTSSYTSDPIDYASYGQGKVGTLTVKLEK